MENCEKHSKKLCAQCRHYDYCDKANRCNGDCDAATTISAKTIPYTN